MTAAVAKEIRGYVPLPWDVVDGRVTLDGKPLPLRVPTWILSASRHLRKGKTTVEVQVKNVAERMDRSRTTAWRAQCEAEAAGLVWITRKRDEKGKVIGMIYDFTPLLLLLPDAHLKSRGLKWLRETEQARETEEQRRQAGRPSEPGVDTAVHVANLQHGEGEVQDLQPVLPLYPAEDKEESIDDVKAALAAALGAGETPAEAVIEPVTHVSKLQHQYLTKHAMHVEQLGESPDEPGGSDAEPDLSTLAGVVSRLKAVGVSEKRAWQCVHDSTKKRGKQAGLEYALMWIECIEKGYRKTKSSPGGYIAEAILNDEIDLPGAYLAARSKSLQRHVRQPQKPITQRVPDRIREICTPAPVAPPPSLLDIPEPLRAVWDQFHKAMAARLNKPFYEMNIKRLKPRLDDAGSIVFAVSDFTRQQLERYRDEIQRLLAGLLGRLVEVRFIVEKKA